MMYSHPRQPCRIAAGSPLFTCAAICLTLLVASSPVRAQPPAAQLPAAEPSGLQAALAIEQVLIDTIARTEKSIVAIATVRSGDERGAAPGFRADPFDRFRQDLRATQPSDPDFVPSEYGTGVVIDPRGLILTMYHVVEQGDRHWVTTAARKSYPAKIRAADPRSGLAVLEIEASDLEPITFGDASKLRKGQIVIALGNPYAIARDGQVSASWGIIANLARKAAPVPSSERAERKPTLHHFGTLIQTDAKLNFGTSGGALINLHGEMVGLTTSIAATAGYAAAAGYAVPIDATFLRVIDTLKEGREVEYGLLGVEPVNLLPEEIRAGRQGLRVGEVWAGTPAGQIGLERGDVITHVNEVRVFDADSLVLEVGKLPAASEVELRLLRDSQPQKFEVTLAKYPVRGEGVVTNRPAAWRGMRVDYPTSLPAEEYQMHARTGDIHLEGCVVITEVEKESLAWKAGLRQKMFVVELDNQRIHNPADFQAAAEAAAGPMRVRLTLPDDQQPWRTIRAE